MWSAFPTSDYYGLSAPYRRHQLATNLPTSPGWLPATSGNHRQSSHVHC